jgi:transposase
MQGGWNKAGTRRNDHRAFTPCAHREDSCLPCHRQSWSHSWVQIAVLLPTRQVHHQLGCHRRRILDRAIVDKIIQILVFGCGYRRIADHTCSATTLRRRGDEWISLGLADRLRLAVLGAYQRLFGLEPEHLAVDGCTTKAPCGGQVTGPSRSTVASRA